MRKKNGSAGKQETLTVPAQPALNLIVTAQVTCLSLFSDFSWPGFSDI